MSGTDTEYDVVIVGGGLVGAALAYGMARDGARIGLIDGNDLAFRASRANFALIWVQGKGAGCGPYAELTRHSASLWKGFAHQLKEDSAIDVQFRQPGGFTVALSETELEERDEFLKAIQAQPGVGNLQFEIVERNRLEKLLPGLGDEVTGASYSGLDGHCNSLLLLRGLHVAFQGLGGRILAGRQVRRIGPGRRSFVISTDDGTFEGEKIVLAAGLGNRALARDVGVNAPVTPLKGQILVTEKCQPFLPYPLVNIRQTEEGGVMIGSSQEDLGFDTSSSMDVVARIASKAGRIFPHLRALNIVRSWAGLRVMTPDGLALYDESTQSPGAFVVGCHSGVTLAAFHAMELAPAILSGKLPRATDPFTGKRFDVHAAA